MLHRCISQLSQAIHFVFIKHDDVKSISPEELKRYIEVKGRSAGDGSNPYQLSWRWFLLCHHGAFPMGMASAYHYLIYAMPPDRYQ